MATVVSTAGNCAVKGDPAYMSIEGTVQFSYIDIRYYMNPTYDSLTELKINGNIIGSWIGTSRQTGVVDINGYTPAQMYTFIDTNFPGASYPAGYTAASAFGHKNSELSAYHYGILIPSYAKTISGVITYTNVATTVQMTFNTTGGPGPSLISITPYTIPASGSPAFVGSTIVY